MSATIPNILKFLNSNNMNFVDQNIDETQPRAKKRRLDHLTWEEKVQRKKLKNRVAAQTSRDRKKAKMEHMEKAVEDLFARNETLLNECENLKEMNKRLMEENQALISRLQPQTCSSCQQRQQQNRSVECEPVSAFGPAESRPLPPGAGTHSAAVLRRPRAEAQREALWKIVLACLLYRTCSTSSTTTWTSPLSSNSPKVCSKISPETLRRALRRQILKNQMIVNKTNPWWGKHQNSWNPPVEVKS